jgi:hypothetical protein
VEFNRDGAQDINVVEIGNRTQPLSRNGQWATVKSLTLHGRFGHAVTKSFDYIFLTLIFLKGDS